MDKITRIIVLNVFKDKDGRVTSVDFSVNVFQHINQVLFS